MSFEPFRDEDFYEAKLLAAQYSFRLQEIPGVEIKVNIWETKDTYGNCNFSFTQSHFLHAPTQAGPYGTSAPFGETVEDALRRALGTFTVFLTSAIKEGHKPSSKWLVENENF
jgi:hypothetical protein